MQDFIEKPSRLILFIVSIIALVTIIILISRSKLINPGGQSLINGHGKLTQVATPSPVQTYEQDENNEAAAGQEPEEYYTYDENYDEEYDDVPEVNTDDGEPVYEQTEVPDNAAGDGEEYETEGDGTEENQQDTEIEEGEQWDEADQDAA